MLGVKYCICTSIQHDVETKIILCQKFEDRPDNIIGDCWGVLYDKEDYQKYREGSTWVPFQVPQRMFSSIDKMSLEQRTFFGL